MFESAQQANSSIEWLYQPIQKILTATSTFSHGIRRRGDSFRKSCFNRRGSAIDTDQFGCVENSDWIQIGDRPLASQFRARCGRAAGKRGQNSGRLQ